MIGFKINALLVFLPHHRANSLDFLIGNFELVLVLNQFSVAVFKVNNSSSELFYLSLLIANSSFIIGKFLIYFNFVLFIKVNLCFLAIPLKPLDFLLIFNLCGFSFELLVLFFKVIKDVFIVTYFSTGIHFVFLNYSVFLFSDLSSHVLDFVLSCPDVLSQSLNLL